MTHTDSYAPTHTHLLSVLRDDIKAQQAYPVQASAGLIKLDAMENPYRLSDSLQRALGERLGRVAINRYPGAEMALLKKALADHAQMPPDFDMVIGNGSDELIAMLALAVAKPGATIMAPLPGFVMYGLSAQLAGVGFVGVDLSDHFDLDVPAMLAAIVKHRPAVVYLAYPNNPTANAWSDADMESVIQAVGQIGGWVVVDEAYQPFAAKTYMDRVANHCHVLVLRTLSKFGLAGVRIGYLMGRQAIVQHLEKIRPPYNVSVLNAHCALFALEHESEFFVQAQAIKSERERLLGRLSSMTSLVVYPSQANMILIQIKGPDQADLADKVFTRMKEKGVLVKNVSKMYPLLRNCLRLTVGTVEENTQLIAALEASL
jgi:histidinol-phosphate aminotransferase